METADLHSNLMMHVMQCRWLQTGKAKFALIAHFIWNLYMFISTVSLVFLLSTFFILMYSKNHNARLIGHTNQWWHHSPLIYLHFMGQTYWQDLHNFLFLIASLAPNKDDRFIWASSQVNRWNDCNFNVHNYAWDMIVLRPTWKSS